MNWLDVLFLLVLALYLVRGYRQGLARQVIGLIGFLVAIAVAVYGSRWLGAAFAGYINPAHLMPLQEVSTRLGLDVTADWILNMAAKVTAFLVLLIIARLLLGRLATGLTAVNRFPLVGPVNRLSGTALGAVKALILILLLIGLLSLLPVKFMDRAMADSRAVFMAEHHLPFLVDKLKLLLISNL